MARHPGHGKGKKKGEQHETSGTEILAALSYRVGGLKAELLPHQLLACGYREPPAWAESARAPSEGEGEREAASGKLFPPPEYWFSIVVLKFHRNSLSC